MSATLSNVTTVMAAQEAAYNMLELLPDTLEAARGSFVYTWDTVIFSCGWLYSNAVGGYDWLARTRLLRSMSMSTWEAIILGLLLFASVSRVLQNWYLDLFVRSHQGGARWRRSSAIHLTTHLMKTTRAFKQLGDKGKQNDKSEVGTESYDGGNVTEGMSNATFWSGLLGTARWKAAEARVATTPAAEEEEEEEGEEEKERNDKEHEALVRSMSYYKEPESVPPTPAGKAWRPATDTIIDETAETAEDSTTPSVVENTEPVNGGDGPREEKQNGSAEPSAMARLVDEGVPPKPEVSPVPETPNSTASRSPRTSMDKAGERKDSMDSTGRRRSLSRSSSTGRTADAKSARDPRGPEAVVFDEQRLQLLNALFGTSAKDYTELYEPVFGMEAITNSSEFPTFNKPAQERGAMVKQLRADFPESAAFHSNADLLRFCVARQFHYKEVVKMYTKHIQEYRAKIVSPVPYIREVFGDYWEPREGEPTITDYVKPRPSTAHTNKLMWMQRCFQSNVFCGHDRTGRPVIYNKICTPVQNGINEHCKPEDRIEYLIATAEQSTLVCDLASKRENREIHNCTIVLDCEGSKLAKALNHVSQEGTKAENGFASGNMPEGVAKVMVVNAPWGAEGVWNMIKMFWDKNTQKKVNIMGGNFKKQLLEVIDEDNLPTIYGGKHPFCWPTSQNPKTYKYQGEKEYWVKDLK